MRDTQGLRTRIALLACVPGLLACSPPPTPQAVSKEDPTTRRRRAALEERRRARGDRAEAEADGPRVGASRKEYYEAKARQAGKSVEEVTPPAQLAAEREDALRERRRKAVERRAEAKAKAKAKSNTPSSPNPRAVPGAEPNTIAAGVVPGDPPFIDGYNPEEEHCISGNWCGALDGVTAVGIDGVAERIGCPSRITGGKNSDTIKADPRTYQGLSSAPNMQGSLNDHGTELRRAESGDDTMCCYHWFEYCSGRPHLGDDGPVLAPVEPGDTWIEGPVEQPDPPSLPDTLRACIAGAWLDDARAEHASVAAFARATLELMALGAPPDLLMQAQQAGIDEVDHARRCFGLAKRYGAGAMQPGALPALGPRAALLPQLAADTFAEGCVGETIAALVAERSLRHCADPEVTQTLHQISDDEARHAALAWSTVAWALREGGRPVAERLELVAERLHASQDAPLPPADADAAILARHGRLDDRARTNAARDAWREVIEPMLDALLTEAAHPEDATRA